MINNKSDVSAKKAFIQSLSQRGFKAKVAGSPADIIAEKDGETWYFEIKMTHQTDTYFGAATSTEWKQAFADSKHYRFVIAKANEAETEFEFLEYTPEEFLEFCTIPPFKVYFNIRLDGIQKRRKQSGKSKSIPLTRENFKMLETTFSRLTK